jgi:hypothetical protein
MGSRLLLCEVCDSSDIRLSRLRRSDLGPLLSFMYPVRCMNCYERQFISIWTVLKMEDVRKNRSKAAHS